MFLFFSYRRGLIAAYVDGFVLACGGKCINKNPREPDLVHT
jgi:hypothetical protein